MTLLRDVISVGGRSEEMAESLDLERRTPRRDDV